MKPALNSCLCSFRKGLVYEGVQGDVLRDADAYDQHGTNPRRRFFVRGGGCELMIDSFLGVDHSPCTSIISGFVFVMLMTSSIYLDNLSAQEKELLTLKIIGE